MRTQGNDIGQPLFRPLHTSHDEDQDEAAERLKSFSPLFDNGLVICSRHC